MYGCGDLGMDRDLAAGDDLVRRGTRWLAATSCGEGPRRRPRAERDLGGDLTWRGTPAVTLVD
uniref:Uncharacterized protein n=1 Tax=Oryza rufipogon TaxID=4529 RepID=A0A0E0QZU4_ORYRU